MKHFNFTDITIVTPDIHEAFNRQPSFHSAPIEYNIPHDCNLFTESLYTFLRTENPNYTAYHVYSTIQTDKLSLAVNFYPNRGAVTLNCNVQQKGSSMEGS